MTSFIFIVLKIISSQKHFNQTKVVTIKYDINFNFNLYKNKKIEKTKSYLSNTTLCLNFKNNIFLK